MGDGVRAVVINAGCANSFTGKPGADAVRRVCSAAAKRFDCRQRDVMVASTGVIGVLLDGYPVYGRRDPDQSLPTLDAFGGHTGFTVDSPSTAVYHHHLNEQTSTHAGTFASDSDADYVKRFDLPPRAIECGSDLRRLSAREMLAVFVSNRARHYGDIGSWEKADVDYSLCRALFPNYRRGFIMARSFSTWPSRS